MGTQKLQSHHRANYTFVPRNQKFIDLEEEHVRVDRERRFPLPDTRVRHAVILIAHTPYEN